jgi:hypothetical protein
MRLITVKPVNQLSGAALTVMFLNHELTDEGLPANSQ